LISPLIYSQLIFIYKRAITEPITKQSFAINLNDVNINALDAFSEKSACRYTVKIEYVVISLRKLTLVRAPGLEPGQPKAEGF